MIIKLKAKSRIGFPKEIDVKPIILAVTGPAGSGKSQVSKIFSELGARVIDADKIAHAVLRIPDIARAVAASFGNDVLTEDRIINRSKLASVAFASKDSLRRLLVIVEPMIHRLLNLELTQMQKKDKSLIVVEAPTLFESGIFNEMIYAVLTVEAPIELRERRCVENRGWLYGEVFKRDSFRVPEMERRNRSSYVIDNIGNEEILRKKVVEVYDDLNGIFNAPITHDKETCQRCYHINERSWSEYEEERSWDFGLISCPVDYFNVNKHKGMPSKAAISLRNLFGAIFGSHKTSDPIPEWCPFCERHKK
jgi:dephospho-CoA kinase